MEYSQEEVIQNLLEEYNEQRLALKNMINDIEGIKKNIDKLFPESIDKRYTRFFEEKVKTATGLFNILLDIRKEISKNLKDEIDIRSRLDKKLSDEDLESVFNIRDLANKVENLNKKKNKVKKSSLEKQEKLKVISTKKEDDEIGELKF